MNQMNALFANDLSTYFSEVDKIPVITKDEEFALAEELLETGSVEAAQKLVMGNLRFVIAIARGYTGYGLPLNDLIQEGNVGLMRAIKRFDPTRKIRLTTYAVHWIKAEIHEYAIKNTRIMKVATTKEQRKLFFKVRSYKKDVNKWFTEKEINNISDAQNVKPEVVRTMESRMYNHDISFDHGIDDDFSEASDADFGSPNSYMPSEDLTPEENFEKEELLKRKYKFLHESMSKLSENHKNVLQRRWLNEDKSTLQEIANESGVSAEAIRQQEVRALQNISKMATWL